MITSDWEYRNLSALAGPLSYAIHLTETSMMWHMTNEEKQLCHQSKRQPAGPIALAGLEALQRHKDPSGFFPFRHFNSVL
ncbi:hypothetical protein I79_010468 [Cricetulus griseus]|uniref:Uncharacterized protein n=1 Tax=Cricetulus griseus TaxID=10029 RepID=G3HIJ7_CRIGR|nr:hypothetical protein I79_010468 [Cricetulus griseus]